MVVIADDDDDGSGVSNDGVSSVGGDGVCVAVAESIRCPSYQERVRREKKTIYRCVERRVYRMAQKYHACAAIATERVLLGEYTNKRAEIALQSGAILLRVAGRSCVFFFRKFLKIHRNLNTPVWIPSKGIGFPSLPLPRPSTPKSTSNFRSRGVFFFVNIEIIFEFKYPSFYLSRTISVVFYSVVVHLNHSQISHRVSPRCKFIHLSISRSRESSTSEFQIGE